MKKKNNIPLFMALCAVLFGVIGSTIAYYSTNNSFENEFLAGEYIINTTETFESPENWKPGDVASKNVAITNEGSISAAVKVCIRQKWEDANGNPLPLVDEDNNSSVFLDFNADADQYWKVDCDPNKYCFYYYKELMPGETTEQLLDTVMFNPDFNVKATNVCTEDPTTHTTTCTSTVDGYSGGKYTLYVDVETVQYNSYQNAWSNPQVWGDNGCENLRILPYNYLDGMLGIPPHTYEFVNTDFFIPNNIDRGDFESIKFLDSINIPNNAIRSWDASYAKNETVMAWYTDTDNNGKYELFIAANGKVKANPDSSYLFKGFVNAKEIDVRNFDTSMVKNMEQMFFEVGMNSSTLNILGIENWDTSQVQNMRRMFAYAGGDGVTIDFSNWDMSSVFFNSSCDIFRNARFTYTGTDDWIFYTCITV